MGLVENLKTKYNMQVQYMLCDNQVRMLPSRKLANRKGWGWKLHSLPLLVEWKFTTLFNQVHAMLNIGKFKAFLQNCLWAEAENTATLLENNF